MAFSFGAAPSAPAFSFGGATQAPGSTSLFGASSAPSTGLFVTPAAPSSAASGGAFSFSFGGPSSSSGAAPATLSLFGAASSAGALLGPSSAPSLFGAAPSSAPSLFGGGPSSAPALFGASSAPSLFGATPQQQQQQQQQQVVAPFAQPDLSAISELMALREAFTPGHPRYRFRHLFFNVVPEASARVRPAGVDELQWRAAIQSVGGADNPDHLWPVVADGMKGLLDRRAAQEVALEEHASRLEALRSVLSSVAQRQRALVEEGLEALRAAHVAQSRRLLSVARNVDALEGRFAQATGQVSSSPATLSALRAKLTDVEKALTGNPDGLAFQLRETAASAAIAAAPPATSALDGSFDESSLQDVFELLRQQTTAVASVQAVLQRAERDVDIMGQELARRV